MTQDKNISTEHQLPGDAKRPDDTLDRNQPKTPEDEQSDRGERPFIAANGEVHGSGAGAGGGTMREDYDDDAAGGGGDLTEARRQAAHRAEDQAGIRPEDYPESDRAR